MPPRRGKEKAPSRQSRVRVSRQARQTVQSQIAVINTMQVIIHRSTNLTREAFLRGCLSQEEFNRQDRMYSLLRETFEMMEFDVLDRATERAIVEQLNNSPQVSISEAPASGSSQESADVPAEGAVVESSLATGGRTSGDPSNVPSEVPDKPTEESSQGHSRSSSESEKNKPEPRRSSRLRKKSKDK